MKPSLHPGIRLARQNQNPDTSLHNHQFVGRHRGGMFKNSKGLRSPKSPDQGSVTRRSVPLRNQLHEKRRKTAVGPTHRKGHGRCFDHLHCVDSIQILLQRNRRKNHESPETIGNLDTNWARDDNKKLFSFLTERCSKWDLSSPGIKPKPSAEEAQSLHHWTTRKIQLFNFKCNNGDVVTCTFFFFKSSLLEVILKYLWMK